MIDLRPDCPACGAPIREHTYRFFACHRVGEDAAAFLRALESGDWLKVQAEQRPAVGEEMYRVYAVACPAGTGLALLARAADADTGVGIAGGVGMPDEEMLMQRALSAEKFAALRAVCPTCKWLRFE